MHLQPGGDLQRTFAVPNPVEAGLRRLSLLHLLYVGRK